MLRQQALAALARLAFLWRNHLAVNCRQRRRRRRRRRHRRAHVPCCAKVEAPESLDFAKVRVGDERAPAAHARGGCCALAPAARQLAQAVRPVGFAHEVRDGAAQHVAVFNLLFDRVEQRLPRRALLGQLEAVAGLVQVLPQLKLAAQAARLPQLLFGAELALAKGALPNRPQVRVRVRAAVQQAQRAKADLAVAARQRKAAVEIEKRLRTKTTLAERSSDQISP